MATEVPPKKWVKPSLANLALCQTEGLEAFIPDLQFRKRDQRFAGQQRFKDGIHLVEEITRIYQGTVLILRLA